MTSTQLAFDLNLVVVHCFTCPHSVARTDPNEAHDAMEAHYRDRHAVLIARIAGGLV